MFRLYRRYRENINRGYYSCIPLFSQIYEYLIQRYGISKVDCILDKNDPFPPDITTKQGFLHMYKNYHDISGKDLTLEDINKMDFINEYIIRSKGIVFIVHYSDVEITNTRKQIHNITDLYVKYTFVKNGNLFEKPKMTRSTFSYPEWTVDYLHSHVDGGPVCEMKSRNPVSDNFWATPCYGEHTIVGYISELCSTVKYDIFYWMALLDQMDAFVKWESIEGRPFKYIENIKEKIIYSPHKSDATNELYDMGGNLKKVFESIMNDYIKIKVCTDEFGIIYKDLSVDMDNLEPVLLMEYLKLYPKPEHIICRRIRNGLEYKYYTEINQNINNSFREIPLCILIFKGEKKYLNVINKLSADINMDTQVFLPEILQNLLKYIKEKINEYDK